MSTASVFICACMHAYVVYIPVGFHLRWSSCGAVRSTWNAASSPTSSVYGIYVLYIIHTRETNVKPIENNNNNVDGKKYK